MEEMRPKGFNISDFLTEACLTDRIIEDTYIGEAIAVPRFRKKNTPETETAASLENLSTGEIMTISRVPALIGKAACCDIIIGDAECDEYISRRHAVIDIVSGHYAIKDMSTNGSYFLNDDGRNPTLLRLPKDSYIRLKHGQIIRFAKRNYRFMLGGEER